MNKLDNPKFKQFSEILEVFDLMQHIDVPTHRDGSILDLLITHHNYNVPDKLVGDLNSDHNSI